MATAKLADPAAEWRGLTPQLVIGLCAALVPLYFADLYLARLEHRELRSEAQRLAAQGERLLSQGKPKEATGPLQQAHALFREDRGYALEFADSLVRAGETERAESVLRDVLDRTPNDGQANLLMARALLNAGENTDAVAYYHRAIYGTAETEAHRTEIRLELADWLAKSQSRDQLLAELLPLEASATRDLALKKHLGELFLMAGSPQRAAGQYRAILAENPDDEQANAGLGEAELEMTNDSAAERAFRRAGKPDRMQIVSEVMALDPTPRRLQSVEKYRRSAKLLELASEGLKACGATAQDGEALTLLGNAGKAAGEKIRGVPSNEQSERLLDFAWAEWRLAKKSCPTTQANREALEIVMKRVGTHAGTPQLF